MHAAVVGHVEWITFARVARVPEPGEIARATRWWEEPGGGGAVAAVQLAKLAGESRFFTALGDDAIGRRAAADLEALGVRLEVVFHPVEQRRAFTHVDDAGERTITVLGERLTPRAIDPLPWDRLSDADVVYVCAADPDAIRHARRARVLVATSRILDAVLASRIELDALVGSGLDPSERYDESLFDPEPKLMVRTEGAHGGSFRVAGGSWQRFEPDAVGGAVVDTYGAGDSFAAGLAFALGRGDVVPEAIAFAARCGAAVLTGAGPYQGQIDGPGRRDEPGETAQRSR
jgi:ribokinase